MNANRPYTVPSSVWLLVIALLVTAGIVRFVRLATTRQDVDLVIYSGRSEELIGPLIAEFEQLAGWKVNVRYGQTAELAATILEEGRHSPADLFFAQDAGALGALARANRLQTLPTDLLEPVPSRFRSARNQWVGVSGRARVLVYHPDRVAPHELPTRWDNLRAPHWRNRLGWAPPNGSFQAFVTAMRVTHGPAQIRDWLAALRDLGTRPYSRNTALVWAVASGEIDAALVNHYYLHALARERGAPLPIRNHYPAEDLLINAAGVGVLDTANRLEAALAFIRFLLTERSQRYFSEHTFEYPLVDGVEPHPDLPALGSLHPPDLDLDQLDDLGPTLDLLQALNIL